MSPKNRWSRREVLKALGLGPTLFWSGCRPSAAKPGEGAVGEAPRPRFGFAVDTTRCIGCGACMRACRAENDVPKGYFRTWVERYRVSPQGQVSVDVASQDDCAFTEAAGDVVKAFFVPKLCNHCEKSVCSQVCPVGATYTTEDGVVLVDEKRCVGCGYCVQACPYGTRFISPVNHVADKCTLCYHRLSRGLTTACVQACPKEARVVGRLDDPHSRISIMLKQRRFRVLKPEMGTHPTCFYIGLDQEVV